MSVINKTGPHRERLGGKAQVNHVEPSAGWAFGYDSLNRATAWNCETGRANFGFSIISEWHEPPAPPDTDPGEGWRLLEPGEVIQQGDEFEYSGHWEPRYLYVGEKMKQGWSPTRRRLPKPFRISDHGIGVYETRDGREATVDGKRGPSTHPWSGKLDCGAEVGASSLTWRDCGKWRLDDECQSMHDLVRYLRPLPKQETPEPQWTCTNEWRDRLFDIPRGTSRPEGLEQRIVNNEWRFVVREQRWTNGTDSEWRPVPVAND